MQSAVPPTKQQCLEIMKRELSKHPWAQDKDRLARAMEHVEKTLNGSRICFLTGSWVIAWKEMGFKGKPTYKGLHALP